MKYCPRCNAAMPDEAIFCSACGADSNNFYSAYGNPYAGSTPYGAAPGFSANSMAIQEFSQKASTIQTLGIFSAVLMFGIGFIFSIVIWIMMSSAKEPFVPTATPQEQAMLESARKKLKLGKTLSFLPILGFALSFFIGFVIGFLGAL